MSKETRTPAEVFKLAIDSGYYDYWEGMCIALSLLKREREITPTERHLADLAIENYMLALDTGAVYLRSALEYCGLPYDEEAATALYLDWDNRPYKEKEDDQANA